jgi:hypothetical protein
MGVTRNDVFMEREKLIRMVKDYVKERAHLYREIPFLALEVNGRHHWSGKLRAAYEQFIWRVNEFVYISLKTGELHGRAQNILEITSNFRLLEPEIIVERLKSQTRQEFSETLERPEGWRLEKDVLRKKLERELGGVNDKSLDSHSLC